MIKAIVAVEKNQGIGFKGTMPWPYLPADMNHFKELTKNHIVIMGANTWISLPKKPLPHRINIVLSKSIDNYDYVFNNIDTALKFCTDNYPDKDIFIIGGQQIYDLCFDIIDKFYVTEIDEQYNCDRFFNLDKVKKIYTNKKELSKFIEPVRFTINEYTK